MALMRLQTLFNHASPTITKRYLDAMAYATSGQETLTGHRAQPEFAKKVTLRLVPQEFLAGQQQLTPFRRFYNYYFESAVYLLQLFLS